MVVAVWTVSGLGAGLINPILSATIYERVPRPLLGRVTALGGTLAYAGMPVGGPVAGLLVATAGFAPAVLVLAAAYFAATTLPALRPQWRELDARRARRPLAVTAPGPARPGTRRTRLPAA
jgi:MFS family permease